MPLVGMTMGRIWIKIIVLIIALLAVLAIVFCLLATVYHRCLKMKNVVVATFQRGCGLVSTMGINFNLCVNVYFIGWLNYMILHSNQDILE
jgi:hypothetical protein